MIVCCGEALIDMLPRQLASGETALLPASGGAIFNTAIALGRLGAPVEFFSGLSNDLFGEQLREALAKSNVGTRYAQLSDRPTTLAFVKLTDGKAAYTFYDENTAGRMLTPDDLPEFADDVQAVHFGAISLVSEPCGSAYEALMQREEPRRVIMFDPNIRPGFIRDRATHLARMHRMLGLADIVKVSDEDLEWLGRDGSAEDTLRKWLERGPKLAIMTAGADGALAVAKSGAVRVPAVTVKVVDTVGAGDTFNAGVLAWLNEAGLLTKPALEQISSPDIEAAIRLGARAAAVTVSRAGANPPWRRELE